MHLNFVYFAYGCTRVFQPGAGASNWEATSKNLEGLSALWVLKLSGSAPCLRAHVEGHTAGEDRGT